MPTPDSSVEALLREVLVASATQSAEIKGLVQRVDGLDVTAREARDVARDTLTQTRAQDIPTKFAELKGHVDQLDQGRRADLLNAAEKITRELRTGFDAHDKRLEALEAFRARLEGAGGVFGWLGRYAPWLGMVLLAGLTAIGFKERLP